MPGEGPFLWLSKRGSPFGFHELPKNGMCVSAFLFVTRPGANGDEILLGKYADVPDWERLAGLEQERRAAHSSGWTIPASQVKFGEEPRAAGKRIAEEILDMPGLALREFPPESDSYVPARFPDLGMHYDIWFIYEASVAGGSTPKAPAWYSSLEFHSPRTLPADSYARSHHDVVARWLTARASR